MEDRLPQSAADRAEACLRRGDVLCGNEEYADAIAAYEEAVQLAPGSAEAHFSLAHAYFMVNGYDRAIGPLR